MDMRVNVVRMAWGAKGTQLHCLVFIWRLMAYKLWKCWAFPPPYCHTPSQTRQLDTQLATNCKSTSMSSVTSPQRSDNDGPQPHLIISAHNTGIWYLAYLSNGWCIVTGSKGTVKIWSLENGGREGTSMKHETGIYNLAVTRDGTRIITSNWKGSIKVWDVKSHKVVKEWTHLESRLDVAISPDDRLVVVGNRIVGIYTMEGRQIGHSIDVGWAVYSMCFSPDGTKLTCGTVCDIRMYDVDSSTLILECHQDFVSVVLWPHDGYRLFSGSDDETIRCWNSDTGEQIGQAWTGHTSLINSLSLFPDGSILVSASWDQTVCFSPSGESVASAG